MSIKAFIISAILGVVLNFAVVAIGLLISYSLDKLFQKTGKNKE